MRSSHLIAVHCPFDKGTAAELGRRHRSLLKSYRVPSPYPAHGGAAYRARACGRLGLVLRRSIGLDDVNGFAVGPYRVWSDDDRGARCHN